MIAQDVVLKVNELIGLDRSLLTSSGPSAEIVSKLRNKIDSLRDNFIVNLPFELTNESDIGRLNIKLDKLETRFFGLKSDQANIHGHIDDYKLKNYSVARLSETELRDYITKFIIIQRYLIYVRTLAKFECIKSRMDSVLNQLAEHKSQIANKTALQESVASSLVLNHLSEIEILIESLVGLFAELVAYSNKIDQTKCLNLQKYVIELGNVYLDKVKAILSEEIESCFKKLSYPVNQNLAANTVSGSLSSGNKASSEAKNEAQLVTANKERFESFFKKLARLMIEIESPAVSKPLENGMDNTLIRLLILPLEKRFKFHFCTNRKTNNLEKPEWYLSQVLQWIKEENEFIDRLVQPIFLQIDHLKDQSAVILFSNCLMNLIRDKLNQDLSNLLKNHVQFSHTIDELILFNTQLETYLSVLSEKAAYATPIFSTLHLICQNEDIFSHWLNLERQLCQKKLDMLFISLNPVDQLVVSASGALASHTGSFSLNNHEKLIDEIWTCKFADIDVMKPSYCAETFVLMLRTMTDRYSNMPYPSKKLEFLNLQIELLNEFHMRLCQIIRNEIKTPFSKLYLGALNSFNYVTYIIDEWKNSSHEQYRKKCQIERQSQIGENISHEEISDLRTEMSFKFDREYINCDTNITSLFEVDGTIFDEIMPSYEKVKEDMIQTITSNLKWEITSRSKLYKREKWMSMTLFSEIYRPTLSQSASEMLISLKNLLHLLRETLAKNLFESILKRITSELDKFFYEDLILQSQFNEGGVAQLDFDITRYLLPILGEYANDIMIDSYFRKTKESLILLKMKQGSAILLNEVICKALNEADADSVTSQENRKFLLYNGRNALREFGVVQLSCEEARNILNLRCDFIDVKLN